MTYLIQQFMNGISIGCIYGLIALGYTMVFGVLRMVNFSHSELFMLGGMVAVFLLLGAGIIDVATMRTTTVAVSLSGLQMAMVIMMSFAGAAAFSGILGVIIERMTLRPLRGKPMIALVNSLGTQIFLRNFAMLFLGRDMRGFPRIMPTLYFKIMGATFTNIQVFIIIVTVLLLTGLLYLVNRTYLGRCIRAVAEDRDVASLMGVDINRTIASVFLIGPAIGGITGVLCSMYFEQVYYATGAMFGIKAWVAAVMGGIGDIAGTMMGGLTLGILETVGAGFLPIVSRGLLGFEYKDIFAFSLMILMLIFRPQGIFGEPTGTK